MDAAIFNFPTAILAEVIEFNAINRSVLEFDEDLIALEEQLAEAIGDMDAEKALDLARRTRGAIIELGYADEDELPTEQA